MSRLTAWVILVAAAALIYSLAFSSYEHLTSTWTSTDSGGLTRVTVDCPSPIQVLLFGAEPEGSEDPGICVPSSRTLALEAAAVTVAGALLVWRPVTRRRPERLDPLSTRINRRTETPPHEDQTATRDD
ncbi:MAG: hypothetical protein WAL25_04550 [Acidimicrobiia bacterium]